MGKKERQKIEDKRYREKFKKEKQAFYAQVGTKFAICGSRKRLACHRKSFEKHMRIANLMRPKLLNEKVCNYARLCYPCHFGVHWVHKFFGLSWEQIISHIRKP